jgi:hypothetical protein
MGSDQNSRHLSTRRAFKPRRNFALTPFFTLRGARQPFLLLQKTVRPELVEGLESQQFRSTHSPAAYHRAFASEIFLKTHAMQAVEI